MILGILRRTGPAILFFHKAQSLTDMGLSETRAVVMLLIRNKRIGRFPPLQSLLQRSGKPGW
jgi:hypothetical protein